jgi:hypothetical protein
MVRCARSVIGTHGYVPETPRLGPGDLQYIQPTVIRNDADFSCPEGIRLVPGDVHGLGR